MKLATALFLAAATLAPALAQERKPTLFPPGAKARVVENKVAANEVGNSPEQMIAAFFALLSKSDLDGAYATLAKGSKIAERAEDMQALKQRTKDAIEAFGPINGYEQLDVKTVGSRLIRRTCVSHGRDFPLRWRFYFYSTNETWRLIDLRVDDRLAGIFGEPEEGKPATRE